MSNNHLNQAQTQATIAQVTVREANGHDGGALETLARLDSARVPAGTILIAEVQGHPRAAISTLNGAVIADPFHRTAELVQMLRTRAGLREPSQGIRMLGFGRPRDGRSAPRPSAPSVPGLPSLPGQAA